MAAFPQLETCNLPHLVPAAAGEAVGSRCQAVCPGCSISGKAKPYSPSFSLLGKPFPVSRPHVICSFAAYHLFFPCVHVFRHSLPTNA